MIIFNINLKFYIYHNTENNQPANSHPTKLVVPIPGVVPGVVPSFVWYTIKVSGRTGQQEPERLYQSRLIDAIDFSLKSAIRLKSLAGISAPGWMRHETVSNDAREVVRTLKSFTGGHDHIEIGKFATGMIKARLKL